MTHPLHILVIKQGGMLSRIGFHHYDAVVAHLDAHTDIEVIDWKCDGEPMQYERKE